jgi:predicted phosphodiesterase
VLELVFAADQGDIMVGGHTHIQMVRRFKDRLILNPGSVGLAMDRVSPVDDIHQAAFGEKSARNPVGYHARRSLCRL